MQEIICAGTVADFKKFIDALHFPEDALFLAEEFPRQTVIKPAKRKELLRFDFLQEVTVEDRQRYTSGRIFTKEAELRWEKKNEEGYEVIYFGPSIELVGMSNQRSTTISLNDYEQEIRCYYLFGKQLTENQCKEIGITPSDKLYAEARIPRLLHYPWTTEPTEGKARAQLQVLEYRTKATAQVMFYRFQDVIPAE